METKMYVITHKMVNIPQISSYTSLFVGAANHETDGNFDEKDNTGSNISQKNSSYCELTGLYWIWKNSNADYVGISHYRRFFSNNAVLGAQKYYINKKDIEEVLTKKRIILPKPRCYEKTTLLAINYAPNRTDVKEMFRAVETCSPDYTKDFIWYFNQNKSYLFNMCVMKKDDFDTYCTWLFPLLSFIENMHDMASETDPYRKRLFGFLSERFFSVWLHHNVNPADIVEFPVINTDESDLTRIRRLAGNVSRNITYDLTKDREKNKAEQRELEKAVFC